MAKTPTEIRSLVPAVAQIRPHIERTCKVNGIEINCGRSAFANGSLREVWIRSVRSPRLCDCPAWPLASEG